jgi:hypothetical protein
MFFLSALSGQERQGSDVRGSLKATKLLLGILPEDIQSTIEYPQEELRAELGAEIME